ncbi:hypothetical protein ACMFMG_006739 [Clarireedia jacksonii]
MFTPLYTFSFPLSLNIFSLRKTFKKYTVGKLILSLLLCMKKFFQLVRQTLGYTGTLKNQHNFMTCINSCDTITIDTILIEGFPTGRWGLGFGLIFSFFANEMIASMVDGDLDMHEMSRDDMI